ncbi:putative zinc metalloproteinase C607.06c [Sergentomyia squamirostris]
MCDGKHEIILKNLQNNEKIPHSVLFLHGVIVEKCSENSLAIILNSEYSDYCSISQKTSEFKYFVRLKKGENKLKLSYCKSELSLIVYQEISENLRVVTPLYIVVNGHDGRFQARERNEAENACRRISLGLEIVQMIFAEKIRGFCGSGRKTFRLGRECQQFHSSLKLQEAYSMTESELWSFFARELIDRMPNCRNHKFVAFIGCTSYKGVSSDGGDESAVSYESIRAATVGNAALASGGLALLGSGTLFSWPESLSEIKRCLEDETKVPMTELMDDSGYRRTFGGCFTTSLGTLLHEMGHIFDLAHCDEGVMGGGSDRLDQMLTLRDFHGKYEHVPGRCVPKGREVKCTVVRREPRGRPFNSTGVYFTENCLMLLVSHKWFNDWPWGSQLDAGLAFNAHTRRISGKFPLQLVEMRNCCGLTERYWIVSASKDTNNIYFTFPPHIQLIKCTIFCIDAFGNMLNVEL